MPETITVRARVYRCDPSTGDPPRYDTFEVSGPAGMRVLDTIRSIYDRQAGDLVVEGELAVRGLIIRHLVLPRDLSGTAEVMRFIAEELSRDSYVNVMAQYRPQHKANRYGELAQPLTAEEYRWAMAAARRHGLWRFAR